MATTSLRTRRAGVALIGAAAVFAFGTVATSASAAIPPVPAAHGGFVVHSFAAVGAEKSPDDITRLGSSIYVTFQNGVGPLGEASPTGIIASTIQQYSLDGKAGKSWSVTGKVDGLTADPSRDRLLLTANEDGNSSFLTLDPSSSASPKRFAYSGLTHGGGTDAISVYDHRIIVSASNPSDPAGPAAYTVELGSATATLTPVLADNATAVSANDDTEGTRVPLALTDPDSNQVVPRSSPRFGGAFMLDAQGDKQLIFLRGMNARAKTASVLAVSQPLDDTVFATSSRHTLWLTDPTHNTVDSVTGPFRAGEAFSTVTPDQGPTYLASLNLSTGNVTPVTGLTALTPKGLLFTGSAHRDDDPDRN
jgi:hypothetical protein